MLYYLCIQLDFVEVIAPALHHVSSCRQVCCTVVGSAIGIFHSVGKLVLDQIHALAQHLI